MLNMIFNRLLDENEIFEYFYPYSNVLVIYSFLLNDHENVV